jgi:hypothetical protein
MSTLYLCGNCLTQGEAELAVFSNTARHYVKVSNCPDCRGGLEQSTISEV